MFMESWCERRAESIAEIGDYRVKQRGYHPLVLDCSANTMPHIPELGPNNLTHFATTVLPRDQAPGVRNATGSPPTYIVSAHL